MKIINNKQKKVREAEDAFLEKYIFIGLTNLNNGFDALSIKYFNKKDFEVILERVEQLGLGIYGIEPWLNGEFYSVLVYEDCNCKPTDSKWYKDAFIYFVSLDEDLQYSASFFIPDNILKNVMLKIVETKK